LEITIAGQTFDFVFPENLMEVCLNVLNGFEYPIIDVPPLEVDVIVDVGANVGSTTLYFADNYPQARIFSFEPAEETFRYLKMNTARFSNIFCYNCALGNRNANVFLYHGKDQCAQNSFYRSGITSSEGEITVMRKASEILVELEIDRISILKIDTEGSEVHILSDIYPTFPVDEVYLEYHSENDRITIDEILRHKYLLAFSKAIKIHRGQVVYCSKTLYHNDPQLYPYKISPEKP
jgi:FkbM family methyltransferase